MAAEKNPHHWITTEVLMQFFADRGVPWKCEVCASEALFVVDAGDGEIIGSAPAFGRRDDGVVNIWLSRHMPVARVMCWNCGNLRLHSLYTVDRWRVSPEPQLAPPQVQRREVTVGPAEQSDE